MKRRILAQDVKLIGVAEAAKLKTNCMAAELCYSICITYLFAGKLEFTVVLCSVLANITLCSHQGQMERMTTVIVS